MNRDEKNLHVLCNNEEQLYVALSDENVKEIIIEADKFDKPVYSLCHEVEKKAAVALPYVFRDITYIDTNGYDEVYVRSLDELAYYKDKCRNLVSDYGLYSMNTIAAEWLREEGIKRITAPVELNEYELKEFGVEDRELIVYGHIPMMVSAQCVRKNTMGCDKNPDVMYMKDRTGKNLPVENKCAYCYNLIYNANPVSLFGIWNKVEKLNPDVVRINLTIENEEETRRVLKGFERHEDPADNFTRGHFTRGVE